jgi:hypothetical protein
MKVLRALRRICVGSSGDRKGWPARIYDALVDLGVAGRATRDMRLFHDRLMVKGLIRPWNQQSSVALINPRTELEQSVERIRRLYSTAYSNRLAAGAATDAPPDLMADGVT